MGGKNENEYEDFNLQLLMNIQKIQDNKQHDHP